MMRTTLPQYPSLSYLKQIAKTLKRGVDNNNYSLSYRISEQLPSYKTGEPLKLSDAQFVIAREHGFASWAKLKQALANQHTEFAKNTNGSDLLIDNVDSEIVNIVCGDIASIALKQSGIPGQRLVWRDLLCIGPLPRCDDYLSFFTKRAEYIKSWTQLAGLPDAAKMARDEQQALEASLSAQTVVLWVWPHLSNHLMLLMLIDWYQTHNYSGELLWIDASAKLNRAQQEPSENSGPSSTQSAYDENSITALAISAQVISALQMAYAAELWGGLRGQTPEALQQLLNQPLGQRLGQQLGHGFSLIMSSLQRYLAELPHPKNGLSQLQQQALQAVQDGAHSPQEIFKTAHQNEQYFLAGDWYFWQLLAALCHCAVPLLQTKNGIPLCYPPLKMTSDFDRQRLELTQAGREVLAGKRCHITLNNAARHWGGVVFNSGSDWRFDVTTNQLVNLSAEFG